MTNITLARPGGATPDDKRQIFPVDQAIFWENISSHVKNQDILEEKM